MTDYEENRLKHYKELSTEKLIEVLKELREDITKAETIKGGKNTYGQDVTDADNDRCYAEEATKYIERIIEGRTKK